MVSAQLWDWSRMEGLEVFNVRRSLSRHPKPHRVPLICSHGSYQRRPRRPWSTAKIKQYCYHLKMEGDLLSMASTQCLKLFKGSQAFPSNLHRHLLSKLGILRNLGDKESWRNSTTTEEQKQTRRTNTFYGPLESHWHFLEPEKKKPPLTSKLTFRSLQKSLTKVSKSNAFRTMFQGVHNPNEEKVVKSLRDTLLSKGQLLEKYDDYHTLLRNFNMSKAEIMFVNMLKWRDSSGVDLITKVGGRDTVLVDVLSRCFQIKLISAMKGSCAQHGSPSNFKLHVKWAPDVYDPPCTLLLHTVKKNHHQLPKARKNYYNKHRIKSARGSNNDRRIANRSLTSYKTESFNARFTTCTGPS
ncbi:hypothetical protein ZIOFF_006045 [Zingiber officinale]|uniref:Uncharacterized protein n=1 Tax=Zingiber officinale TaxID=94328 RepID=A0A8J5I258_ZINOF|nr:hypothetical protein ZIOFF_006045 [Zingiber officinale]